MTETELRPDRGMPRRLKLYCQLSEKWYFWAMFATLSYQNVKNTSVECKTGHPKVHSNLSQIWTICVILTIVSQFVYLPMKLSQNLAHCFFNTVDWGKCMRIWYKITLRWWKYKGPARSESISHLNNNMISKTSEFGLQRKNFRFENTASNWSYGLRTYIVEISELENPKSFILT